MPNAGARTVRPKLSYLLCRWRFALVETGSAQSGAVTLTCLACCSCCYSVRSRCRSGRTRPFSRTRPASATRRSRAQARAGMSCFWPETRSIEARRACRCWPRSSATGTVSNARCSSRSIPMARSIRRRANRSRIRRLSIPRMRSSCCCVFAPGLTRTWRASRSFCWQENRSSRSGPALTRSTGSPRVARGTRGTTTTRAASASACSAKPG